MQIVTQQQHDALDGLPSGISHETAHHILYIGKVAFLKRRHAAGKPSALPDTGSSAGQASLSRADAGKALSQLMRADQFDAPKFSRFIAAMWNQVRNSFTAM